MLTRVSKFRTYDFTTINNDIEKAKIYSIVFITGRKSRHF